MQSLDFSIWDGRPPVSGSAFLNASGETSGRVPNRMDKAAFYGGIMSWNRFLSGLLLALGVLAGSARAESKNEVGLLLGGTLIPGQSLGSGVPGPGGRLSFSPGLTLQATYARRIAGNRVATVHFEVPFVATPSNDISSANPNPTRLVASLFITPGLRVKLFPGAGISPFFAVGGGYARFDASKRLVTGAPNPSPTAANTGAFQIGGGVDIKFLPFLGLRGEVRDFYSGLPQYNVSLANDKQHNVVVSGGIVLHF
jgi:hypothetical protein